MYNKITNIMRKAFMCFVALLAIAFALPASAMQIYVHYGNGTWPTGISSTSFNTSGDLILEVEPSDSFENLKTKIEDKTELTPDHITLSYGTYDNLPDDGTLYEYGITSGGTTLTMTYNPLKYTSAVAMSALQVGDTLAEGFSLTGNESNYIYFVANRHKSNENLSGFLENISLDQIQSIGANCVFSTLVNEQSITFAPVDENGRDGDAWVVTEVESIAGFTNITIAGIRIPGPPITVRMAAGTEEAANWTLASGDASVQGNQVLGNVMSGSQVTATYSGTRKVKSVKAVKYVPPVVITWNSTNVFNSDHQHDELDQQSDPLTYEGITISMSGPDDSYFRAYDHVRQTGSLVCYGQYGDSFTFTAPAGKKFCKIEIINDEWSISFDQYGDWTQPEDTKVVWSGTAANEVTLSTVFASASSLNSIVFKLIDAPLSTLTISGQTIYYVPGESWADAITNHQTENAGWTIYYDMVLHGNDFVADGVSNPVSPGEEINPNGTYSLDSDS